VKRLLALVALAACGDPPPFSLKFRITDGDVQACTSASGAKATSCSDIPMLCDSLVSIRIFAPGDSTAPFISACEPLPGGTSKSNTVCQIASIDLTPPATPTKLQTLEVDMAVYRRDPRLQTPDGGYQCPADLAFGADGFFVPPDPCDPQDPSCTPMPALAGRGFYHPGDEETVVTLGCSNLGALEDMTCVGETTLPVTATVTDFDTGVSVSSATADGLLVSVGEPTFDSTNGVVLNGTNTHPLARQMGPVPSWHADIEQFVPVASACIEVLEDGAQTTAAVTCTNSIGGDELDLPGIRLAKGTLDSLLPILPAHAGMFPLDGLVIGKALTYVGAPASGVFITPGDPAAHIYYLSNAGTFTPTGPTGDSGLWISLDAPYGTVFHALGPTPAPDAFGGLIAGKADIVITQLKPPGNG
jgi:hypothetical protein